MAIRATIAITTMAKMPVHQWQQRHRNEGQQGRLCINDDDNAIATRGQCQLEDDKDAIATRATMLLWIKGDNAIVMRATMPSIRWQGCLPINNGNNTIVMRVTIAFATVATTLHINGNNAIATRGMMPA
jgi:hypothetical protein